MVHYNRLGYDIKGNLSDFSVKNLFCKCFMAGKHKNLWDCFLFLIPA